MLRLFFCSRMLLLRLYVWKESDHFGVVFLQHCELSITFLKMFAAV